MGSIAIFSEIEKKLVNDFFKKTIKISLKLWTHFWGKLPILNNHLQKILV
jgi:hypothetical protein